MQKRRRFAPAFKAKVALEALAGEHTLADLAAKPPVPIIRETTSPLRLV